MNHPELAAVCAEHAAPQHASTEHVHSVVDAVHELVAQIEHQMIEYRRLLRAAKRSPNGAHDKAEWLQQTFDAAGDAVTDLGRNAERVADIFSQLDRYVGETRELLAPPNGTDQSEQAT